MLKSSLSIMFLVFSLKQSVSKNNKTDLQGFENLAGWKTLRDENQYR